MIRKTLRWLLTLLALAATAGGAAAWYAWVQCDEYARQELRRRLAEIGPGCDISIGRVRFDWDRSVHVHDFAVRPKGKDVPPTLVVPEAVLEIDRERFLNDQTVDVQVIRLIRPQLEAIRRPDGTWSVEDLGEFRLDPTIAVPEWQIEDATIRFRLEQAGAKPVVLTLRDADLRLVPAGRRQLTIRGLSDLADAGPLQVAGEIDLDRGTWSLSGSVRGLNTSGDIAAFLLRSSSQLRDQVAALGRKLRDAEETLLADDEPAVMPNVVPVRTASRDRDEATAPSEDAAAVAPNGRPVFEADSHDEAPCDLAGLGINAMLDLTFALSQREGAASPDYRVHVDCKDGEIANPFLPFPLRHLRGQLDCDNTQVTLTSLQAEGGGTALRVDGAFSLGTAAAAGFLSLSVTDLVVSDQYTGRLPPAAERLLDALRPSGPVDIVGIFDRDAAGRWSVRDFRLTAKGASVTPEPFPYPIRDIVGTFRQVAPGRFEADMHGTAGARPIHLVAMVADGGAGAEVDVRINANGVPLDETFRAACPPETQTVLEQLGLRGTADVTEVRLFRPAGPGRKLAWGFEARVYDGELEYERFPYRLSQLVGDVSYDSESEVLHVRNAVGRHGPAVVSGSATYRKIPDLGPDGTSPIGEIRPGLTLALAAEQVGLGDDLRVALPPALQRVRDELNLGGTADLEVDVSWVPGNEPHVELPKFELTDGVLNVQAFPYVLHTITAEAAYTPPGIELVGGRPRVTPARVEISEFVGWHDGGVRVVADGSTVTVSPDGQWHLSLPRLVAEDLPLGSEFRRAAPEDLRRAIEALDPRGRFDVAGRLDLYGSRGPRTPVVADWDLVGTFVGASVKPGIEVTQATGEVRCVGRVNEAGPVLSGRVALREATVFGQRLEDIRGPFRLENGQVQIGSRAGLASGPGGEPEPPVPIEERLTAIFLDPGRLTLDALINLGATPTYAGRVTLTGGSLERYVRSRTGGGNGKLSGVMTGQVDFQGRGISSSGVVGQGWLEISPAELYELPVVMQMFKVLFPAAPPDNTAFRSAQLFFTIRDSAFVFEPRPDVRSAPIVLTGDVLRLEGGGYVGFDGKVRLTLDTKLPQNPVKGVSVVPVVGPVVSRVVGGAVSLATTGWVSVVVEGTTDDPSARVVPLKSLEDGWRRMFGALGPSRTRTAIWPDMRR